MPVLLLTLETLLFIAIDRKMYGTFYTPTIFLSVPYLCIVFVFILFADNFNFYSLYLPMVHRSGFVLVSGLYFELMSIKKNDK